MVCDGANHLLHTSRLDHCHYRLIINFYNVLLFTASFPRYQVHVQSDNIFLHLISKTFGIPHYSMGLSEAVSDLMTGVSVDLMT